jgi:hypothetical protein
MISASACTSAARANRSDLVAGVNNQLFRESTDFRNLSGVTAAPSKRCHIFSAELQDVRLMKARLLWFGIGLPMSSPTRSGLNDPLLRKPIGRCDRRSLILVVR